MCIDYTNLNNACPKEQFVLPRIDQIIDSTAGSESLCFLDAYSGYNQIKMAVEDEEKTVFITPFGAFCYTAMTFGLKNAGATYQRCMQEFLASQIGRNIHVYINDVVVKSARQGDLLRPGGNFRQPAKIQDKAQPRQVHLRCTRRTTTGLRRLQKRDRGEPNKDRHDRPARQTRVPA